MEDLARQVGIGKGTIYLHFPGKEELALAHVDRIVERLLQRLREISATRESPPERIRTMLVTQSAVPLRQRRSLFAEPQ